MEIIRRGAWTSYRPTLSSIHRPTAFLFIHHDVYRSLSPKATEAQEREMLRELENFHRTGREMTALAYNFWITPSGRVYEGRGWARAGGHTYGWNDRAVAICFNGNFENQKPTKAALDSARALIALGKVKGHLTQSVVIRGHRDVGAQGGGTACPGKFLYAKIAYLSAHPKHPHSHEHPHLLDGHHHHRGKGHRIHPHRRNKDPDHHHLIR